MRKFIKVYRIKRKDLPFVNGVSSELAPDTRLYGFFGDKYERDDQKHPYDVAPETASSYDTYNNLLSQHRGRRYNINVMSSSPEISSPEGGVLPIHDTTVYNTRPQWRGYSALSYSSKPDRANSLIDNWRIDPDSPRRPTYDNTGKSEGLYNNNSATVYLDRDALSFDRITSSHNVTHPFSENPAGFLQSMLEHGNSDEEYISIPLVVEAEDDDVVSVDDVLNRNYEPGRDFLDEVHLKRIRNKLPLYKGLYKLPSVSVGYELHGIMIDATRCRNLLSDMLVTIKDDVNNKLNKTLIRHINSFYNFVNDHIECDLLPKFDSIISVMKQSTQASSPHVKVCEECLNSLESVLKKIESWHLKYIESLRGYVFNYDITEDDDSDKAVEHLNNTNMINNFIEDATALIDALGVIIVCTETAQTVFNDVHTYVKDAYPEIDTEALSKFINEQFNYDSDDTSSDMRIKNVRGPIGIDMYDDDTWNVLLDNYNRKQQHNNICEACLGIGR